MAFKMKGYAYPGKSPMKATTDPKKTGSKPLTPEEKQAAIRRAEAQEKAGLYATSVETYTPPSDDEKARMNLEEGMRYDGPASKVAKKHIYRRT